MGKTTAGRKLGIDVTKKLSGGGNQRRRPSLIKIDESVKAKVERPSNFQ